MRSRRLRPRREYLKRTAVKKRSRKPSETTRIYGPPARRAWVKSLPCIVCDVTPSENAHTESGGVGRKADASTIAPMCGRFQNGHHYAYDHHQPPFDTEEMREWARMRARMTDEQWQQRGHP